MDIEKTSLPYDIIGRNKLIQAMFRVKNDGSVAQSYHDRGFCRGSILRVRMKNFLTYDDCEVFPGPKLNVVIGPNGTGKSAMTHAICLACAGTTGDIGRSRDLSTFVKQGKEDQECFVEVDILLSAQAITTVRRTITSESRTSKYQMNGKEARQNEVKQLMAELSIDVDNLCSFMPQDRVGAFSQFNPKQILQETLKSINATVTHEHADGDITHNLYEEQESLSKTETVKEDKKRLKDGKQNTYNHVTQQIQKMSTEMERLTERAKAIELHGYYNIKLIKVKADEVNATIKQKDTEITTHTNNLHTLQASVAPLEAQQRDLNKRNSQLSKHITSVNNTVARLDKDLNKIKATLDEYEEQIETCAHRIVSQKVLKQQEEAKLAKIEAEISGLQKQLDEVNSAMHSIEEELEDIKQKSQQATEKKSATDDQQREYHQQLQGEFNNIKAIDREVSNLQDAKQILMNKLKDNYQSNTRDMLVKDTISAMEYLDQHEEEWRRSGRLIDRIYGPVALYLQVQDPACVVMLEKAIPINKLLGYIALNDQDSQFLKHELRDRMRLKIDVYTMYNTNINYPLPYSQPYLQSLGNYMDINYLSDQLRCDDAIRAYLYTFCSLHTIMWARTDRTITSELLNKLCMNNVNMFKLFVHDVRDTSQRSSNSNAMRGKIIEYSGRKSRYATNLPPSTSSSPCYPRNILSTNLSTAVDEKRARLQERKATHQQQITIIEQKMKSNQDKLNTLGTELMAYRNEKARLTTMLKAPDIIKQKIQIAKGKARDIQKKLEDDAKHGDKQRLQDYCTKVNQTLKCIAQFNHSMDENADLMVNKQCIDIVKDQIENQLSSIEQQLQDFHEQEKKINYVISTMKQQKNLLAKELQAYEKELEDIARGYGGNAAFAQNVYSKVMAMCPENTKEALETRLIELNVQIKAIVENPMLKQRYEEMLAEQAQLEKELKIINKEYENIEEAMKARSERWLEVVRAIANKLNIAFNTYMSKLQFDGEVVLRETGKLIDYEMQLRVSFHKDSPLVDLSGSRHSGGERAVSTVMYLMALQEMTSAPFRVVDEINQGMDERNERLVMDRIVKTCCGDTNGNSAQHVSHSSSSAVGHGASVPTNNKPQYFLVSPKLLQALQALDHDDVTVLLVWNGPLINSKWRFEDILNNLRMKARGVKREAVDDVEEEHEDRHAPVKRRIAIKK